jgi:CRP/FNR family transcriptional regulator
VIFRQGDPVEGIYCIEAGTVAVRKSGARGGEAITRIHQDGETVGYPDHFSDGTHTGTAQALTDSRLCFIGREALSELLERNPALGLRFLGRLAGDLQQTEETLIAERTLPVRARLAHALLVLKDRFDTVDESGAITLELPFSRQDLACLIGARPESLSRAIRELEEAGVARFQGRTVILPDLDTLLDELERSGEPQA